MRRVETITGPGAALAAARGLEAGGLELLDSWTGHDATAWVVPSKEGYGTVYLIVPCQCCLDRDGGGRMTGEVAEIIWPG